MNTLIKEALQKGIDFLKEETNEAPAREAGVLLAHTLRKELLFIYTNPEMEISKQDMEIYFSLLYRRGKGEPLQYITGRQEFMSLEFFVGPGVLIPRQDTEILVEAVLEIAKASPGTPLRILDLGTGSGCIAISLAYNLDPCHVTAVDISEEALDIARRNAKHLKVEHKVNFVKGNLFEPMDAFFDIIVSNPPYIETEVIESLQREVRDYEPQNALDGGVDGLDYYRKILVDAPRYLKPQGWIALEIGYNQGEAVENLAKKYFTQVRVIKDLSQNHRVVVGQIRNLIPERIH